MFSSWLDKIALRQNQIELQAANHNPKQQDNSFYVLLDLLEKGYDMVSWVRTDDEPACDLCKFYNDHKTTWRLSEFLGLTRSASLDKGILITAAIEGPWEELDDSDRIAVLRTPLSAYTYAKGLGFVSVPEEVVEEISKDLTVSEYFLEGLLESSETEKVPAKIIDTVGGDAPFIDRLNRNLGGQRNYPEQLKFRGATEEEVALEDQKGWNTTLLRYDSPLYEHAHINCKCQLMVWKSDNPSDVVYVDARG